jgi:hypothetical protein
MVRPISNGVGMLAQQIIRLSIAALASGTSLGILRDYCLKYSDTRPSRLWESSVRT